jgi:DNA-binding IclR family transcriptional regulator
MAKAMEGGQGQVAPTVVRPVANAIALMRHLGTTGSPATVTQLSRLLGINTSTCFNILRTLVAEDMLVFDEEAKTYQIGLGAVLLAQQALSEAGKAEMLRPMVEAVARRHCVTLTLWRLGETDRHLVVGAAETDSPYRIHMEVGLRSALFAGAIGRYLVTERGLSEAEIDAIYPTLHWTRPPGLDTFKAQVAEAAARGWGEDHGNYACGVKNIGVVARRDDGPARYGLVASTFIGQLSQDEIEALASDMIALAGDICGLD